MALMTWLAALSASAIVAVTPTNPEDANPDAVARTLIYATQSICVPYVVDGVDIGKLVQRPGISKRVDYVHGVDVTRYSIDAPGHPDVTPVEAKDHGVGPDGRRLETSTSCWILAWGSPTLAREVAERFRDRFVLDGYETKPPHDVPMPGVMRTGHGPLYVACVRGRRVALVFINYPHGGVPLSPDGKAFMEIHVESSPGVTEAEGCTWPPN